MQKAEQPSMLELPGFQELSSKKIRRPDTPSNAEIIFFYLVISYMMINGFLTTNRDILLFSTQPTQSHNQQILLASSLLH